MNVHVSFTEVITVALDLSLNFEAIDVAAGTETADTACSRMTMHSVAASCFHVVIHPHHIYCQIASSVVILFMKPAQLLCAVSQG